MLVQQIIHRHNAEDIPGGLLFIDFAHAYDYISQEYIIRVLEEMKFPQSFLNAIKMTMTNLSARVIINGDLSPRFPVDNGGRQGDPLFPLIYVIALEGLTALIKADTLFKGITSPNPEVLVTNAGQLTTQ
jgi:Reverse transcriptase (RNA-dependent DNA polymerase).